LRAGRCVADSSQAGAGDGEAVEAVDAKGLMLILKRQTGHRPEAGFNGGVVQLRVAAQPISGPSTRGRRREAKQAIQGASRAPLPGRHACPCRREAPTDEIAQSGTSRQRCTDATWSAAEPGLRSTMRSKRRRGRSRMRHGHSEPSSIFSVGRGVFPVMKNPPWTSWPAQCGEVGT
jgi:hypothetical protein